MAKIFLRRNFILRKNVNKIFIKITANKSYKR